jgi:hypothetical protein
MSFFLYTRKDILELDVGSIYGTESCRQHDAKHDVKRKQTKAKMQIINIKKKML